MNEEAEIKLRPISDPSLTSYHAPAPNQSPNQILPPTQLNPTIEFRGAIVIYLLRGKAISHTRSSQLPRPGSFPENVSLHPSGLVMPTALVSVSLRLIPHHQAAWEGCQRDLPLNKDFMFMHPQPSCKVLNISFSKTWQSMKDETGCLLGE